jgi:hypothetical protein
MSHLLGAPRRWYWMYNVVLSAESVSCKTQGFLSVCDGDITIRCVYYAEIFSAVPCFESSPLATLRRSPTLDLGQLTQRALQSQSHFVPAVDGR